MISGITGKPGAKIAVEHEHFRGGIRVLLWNDDCYYRCTFEQVPHEPTMSVPTDESFLRFSHDEAKRLAQALYDAGIRPDTSMGEPMPTMFAQSEHIGDLRKSVEAQGTIITTMLDGLLQSCKQEQNK